MRNIGSNFTPECPYGVKVYGLRWLALPWQRMAALFLDEQNDQAFVGTTRRENCWMWAVPTYSRKENE